MFWHNENPVCLLSHSLRKNNTELIHLLLALIIQDE